MIYDTSIRGDSVEVKRLSQGEILTYHKVPSTSKTIPFSLGAGDPALFELSSGANRRGSRTTDVVMMKVRLQVCEVRETERQVDGVQRVSSLSIESQLPCCCD